MIGRHLSHFRIVDRIGEGGMGVVYRAEDEKLQRVVALKVLPPEKLADEERRLRFVREARTAAAVTHPNIAVVHEIDEADGVVFIAMELIEGKTLREVIGGKPMPLREALRLGVEIAEGLSAAHQAKVIHRDLKPDNVIVTPGGHVKILDFGLAKLLEERAAIDPDEASKLATVSDEMTQAGRVLGTAAYMSPEQARGLAVDARSDLFSFGIVLYQMVTGKAPFRGTTSMDTLTAILREQPIPAVQLNPEIPAELERIIGKCLEKEPGERYQDARDLVVDLRKVKRDTESGAVSRAPLEARVTATRLRRALWASAIAVGLIVCATAAWRAFRPVPSEPQAAAHPATSKASAVGSEFAQPDVASIAVLPFANMSGDPNNEYFADGLAEELLNGLTNVRGLRVIARTSSFQFKGRNEDVRVIGQKLNVGAILEGSVRKSKDRVRITAQLLSAADGFHLWSETYDRKLDDIFAVQDEITRAVVGALKVKLLPDGQAGTRAGTTNVEAYNTFLRARALVIRGGPEALDIAVHELQRAVALDPAYALAWVGLANAYWSQGDFGYVPMDDALRRARASLDRAFALDADLPEALSLASILGVLEDWDFARADEQAQRAVALAPGSSDVLNTAWLYSTAWGRFDEAYELSSRAIQLDPLNAWSWICHSLSLFHLGRQDEAESTLVDLARREPTNPAAHGYRSVLLLLSGRPEEALSEAGQVMGLFFRLMLSAAAHHALGQKSESDRELGELIDKFSKNSAYQIAEVYAFRGETDRAFEWLERAKNQRDSGLIGLSTDPLLRQIRGDPRYAAFLKKLHLVR